MRVVFANFDKIQFKKRVFDTTNSIVATNKKTVNFEHSWSGGIPLRLSSWRLRPLLGEACCGDSGRFGEANSGHLVERSIFE